MKKINKKKKITFLFLPAVLAFYKPMMALALETEECARILYDYKDYFVQNGIIQDALRFLKWSLIKGVRFLAENSQNLYRNTLGLIDFTQFPAVNDWMNTFKGVFTAILALSIMWFGITLIVNHKKKPEIITSIMLAALTISALSSIMITANQAVAAFCNELASTSVADSIVNNNFYDLMYIDSNYGLGTFSDDAESLAKYHYDLKDFNIDSIEFNEVINYKNPRLSADGKDLLSKSFTYYSRTDYVGETVYNGWGWNSGDDADLFNEFYYRYQVNTFTVVVSLIAVIIVYVSVSYKTCRLIYELPIKRILAMLYSADITGTQKTLKVLGSVKDSYIILALTAITLKVFQLMQTFLQEKFADNGFTYCILLLFTAFAVIDGPNIIQALTGEDAGLQSGYTRIMAFYNGGKGMKDRAVGHIGNMGRGAVGAYRYHKIKNAMGGDKTQGKSAKDLNLNSNAATGSSGQDANKDMKNAMKNDGASAQGKADVGQGGNDEMKKDLNALSPGQEANQDMKDNMNTNADSGQGINDVGKDENAEMKKDLDASSSGQEANQDMKDNMNTNADLGQGINDVGKDENAEMKKDLNASPSGQEANQDMKSSMKNNAAPASGKRNAGKSENAAEKNVHNASSSGKNANQDIKDSNAEGLGSTLGNNNAPSKNEDIQKGAALENHASDNLFENHQKDVPRKGINQGASSRTGIDQGTSSNRHAETKRGNNLSGSKGSKANISSAGNSKNDMKQNLSDKSRKIESRINREDNLK